MPWRGRAASSRIRFHMKGNPDILRNVPAFLRIDNSHIKRVTIGDLIQSGKLIEVHCSSCRPARHLYIDVGSLDLKPPGSLDRSWARAEMLADVELSGSEA
jgi:hypothetical protein